ncbi:DUF2752 domain-containing protein [Rubrolithibacter danxiaensis]|uniref:DUF2752 domain-containing protein n=1 Tax=Rubrolithibacter danxiaensis TaxID=3390805 RepID=UPI003BF8F7C5
MLLKRPYFELTFWFTALILLISLSPEKEQHFSLCPLANLGTTWCPGCGLGRSISSFLHGDIKSSLHFHWFGIPSLFILIHRIFILTKVFFSK